MGAQVDVWALGVVLHVLLVGKFPFTNEKVRVARTLSLHHSRP